MRKLLAILLLLFAGESLAMQVYVTGSRSRTEISWNRPVKYMDGSSLPASEPLTYQVYRNGIMLHTTTGLTTLLLDEPPGLQCYTVTAKVVATGKESDHQNPPGCKMQVFDGPTEGSIIRR